MTVRYKILPIIIFFCLSVICGCGKTRKSTSGNNKQIEILEINEEEMKIDNSNCLIIDSISFQGKEALKNYLKEYKQYIAKEGGTATYVIYEEDKLYYIFPLFYYWLNKNGYKSISQKDFREKAKEIYGVDIQHATTEIEKNNNYFLFKSKLYTDPYGPNFGYTYFVKDGCFIFRPTLSDELANETTNGQNYTCFKPNWLHQNKFLFNDSQSSLTWLLNNDLGFLEMLIRDLGYDKNDRVNKAILDKISKEYLSKQPTEEKDLINLFAKKDYSGNLQIREGLMKFVLDNTTKENYKYLRLLERFGSTLNSSSPDNKKMNESFSEQEKFKILAYISYYVQNAYNLYWEKHSQDWNAESFLYFILSSGDEDSNNFLQQVRDNNYYGLDGFDKMVDDMVQYIKDEPELRF